MTPREYWNEYVTRNGGIADIAKRTGIAYSTLASVHNGQRGIGKALARRLKAMDPLLDEKQLVWVAASEASNG